MTRSTKKTASTKKSNKNLSSYLEDFKIGSLSLDDMMQGSTKNLEAIANANRAILEGYTDLAKRQLEMLKEFLDELKELAGDDETELTDKLKSIVDIAKEDLQDLQKIATKTNTKAQEILKKRTNANVDAWKKAIDEARAKIRKEKPAPKKAARKAAPKKKAAAKRPAKSAKA